MTNNASSQKTLHIGIVSHQVLANYLPYLQMKPDAIYLLSSSRMAKETENLERQLKQCSWSPDVKVFNHTPDSDVKAMYEFGTDICADLEPFDKVYFNATGGTKLMALSYQDVFTSLIDQCSSYYFDSFNKKIHFLDKEKTEVHPIESTTNLHETLSLHGFQVESYIDQTQKELHESISNRQNINQSFAEDSKKYENFLHYFRVQHSNNSKKVKAKRISEFKDEHEQDIITRLHQQDLLTIKNNEPVLTEDQNKFLTGGWLEEYTYLCALNAKVPEVKLDIKVKERTSKSGNQIDVLLMNKNQMLLVECKSGKHKEETTYKIEALAKELGGSLTAKLLVSHLPLTSKRPEGFEIHTIKSNEMGSLQQVFEHWVEHGKLPKTSETQ